MGQLIFKEGLVETFINRVEQNDEKFIALYTNQEEFKYSFDTLKELEYSDIPKVPTDLGDRLVQIFEKNMDPLKPSDYKKADFECAKYLYESIRITPKQASNLSFWNYLHHFDCYKYIHKRWNRISENEFVSKEVYIKRHWLMNLSSQKHLIVFPLTTLWWSIHISVDEAKENPYELAEVYFGNNRYRTVTFGGSSFVRHKEAILGILEYILENNLNTTTELGDNIAKFVNLLGGSKPLSYFDRNWFKDRIDEYLKREAKTAVFTNKIPTPNSEVDTDKVNGIEKIFYLNKDGNYRLSKPLNADTKSEFDYQIVIPKSAKKGWLLMCYNEDGYINQVTIESLLKKDREGYKNGLYPNQTLNSLVVIPKKSIIGIVYTVNGVRFFKAHLSSNLKQDNNNVGLQGYKTMYIPFDEIKYYILPLDIEKEISKLIFKSFTASGKNINNEYYKEEFEIIKKHINIDE